VKRLLLVGAGHAHLYLLKRARAYVDAGAAVTVLAPEDFWYSGLATGMVGGRFAPEEDRIALDALLAPSGATLVRDRAIAIDRAAGTVHRAAGAPLAFDILSLDIGSIVAPLPGIDESDPRNFAAKPIARLAFLRRQIERSSRPLRVLVVGGGVSAVELAANLAAHAQARVTIAAAGPRLAASLPEGAGSFLARRLAARGVVLRLGAKVTRIAGDEAWTEAGSIGFDLLVRATGLVPPPLLATLGLPLLEGALAVGADLGAPGDARVHAAGDCAAVAGARLPMIGVHAVRQAPVLHRTLCAQLGGRRPPLRYRAQRRALLILALGDGSALASWGGWWLAGRPMRWLKDRIDRSFLARYRQRPGRRGRPLPPAARLGG
jgi:NADH dehydrogenase FAD-containing subunit